MITGTHRMPVIRPRRRIWWVAGTAAGLLALGGGWAVAASVNTTAGTPSAVVTTPPTAAPLFTMPSPTNPPSTTPAPVPTPRSTTRPAARPLTLHTVEAHVPTPQPAEPSAWFTPPAKAAPAVVPKPAAVPAVPKPAAVEPEPPGKVWTKADLADYEARCVAKYGPTVHVDEDRMPSVGARYTAPPALWCTFPLPAPTTHE